jgi:hypothetical protein
VTFPYRLAGVAVTAVLAVMFGSPAVAEPTPSPSPSPSESPSVSPTPSPSPTDPLFALASIELAPGKRLVTGDATAVVWTTPEAARGAAFALRLTCGDVQMGAIQNTPSGSTLSLHPRMLVEGADSCTLYGAKAMPADQSGSIRTSGPVGGSMGYTPTVQPNRIVAGQSYDYLPTEWDVPVGVTQVTITGDQKVTTCTSVGGSRDNGSPYLCEGHVNPVGSTVRLQVWVQQRSTTAGGFCVSQVARSADVKITAQTHHFMSYKYAYFTLSADASCTRSVRVKVRATVLSGSDLVLHRPGSATTVFAAVP